jgi:hypothetical protein
MPTDSKPALAAAAYTDRAPVKAVDRHRYVGLLMPSDNGDSSLASELA